MDLLVNTYTFLRAFVLNTFGMLHATDAPKVSVPNAIKVALRHHGVKAT